MTIKEFLDPGASVTPTPFLSEDEEDTSPRTPEERVVLKRAMASFDNLVALANHQETLKEARKIVWRDKGEPVAELGTVKQCLEHAGLGGVRTSNFSFNFLRCTDAAKALQHLLLESEPRSISCSHCWVFIGYRGALTGTRPLLFLTLHRDFRLAVIRRALFGEDSFRSAAMMGKWSSFNIQAWSDLPQEPLLLYTNSSSTAYPFSSRHYASTQTGTNQQWTKKKRKRRRLFASGPRSMCRLTVAAHVCR